MRSRNPAAALVAWMLLQSVNALAQETPIGPAWWPSAWGEGDERGAANRLGPDDVLRATALIDRGEIYALGRPYDSDMPILAGRHFSLTLVGSPTSGPLGENGAVWNDDLVSAEISQVGTQFDGLGHFGVRVGENDVYYNGFDRNDITRPYGLARLGIENVGPIFTRGVLIDIAGLKGVVSLEPGYEISVADLETAVDREGVRVEEGDAVLIHTGHGALWGIDNDAYAASAPGIGLGAAAWLADRGVVLVGADNGAVDVQPGPDPDRIAEVHQFLLARNGIYLFENLRLDELADDRVYEFAFVFSPLPLVGSTGSPGNPIAVR
jgi:kynurenine formamidase